MTRARAGESVYSDKVNAVTALETHPSLDRPAPAPNGRALVVADVSREPALGEAMEQVGFASEFVRDPYAAMLELSRRPLAFRALLLSLASLHPHELAIIEVAKRRFPHLEVLMADVAGRSAGLAEAVRLGADAVLEGRRLHRVHSPARPSDRPPAPGSGAEPCQPAPPATADGETVLSADE